MAAYLSQLCFEAKTFRPYYEFPPHLPAWMQSGGTLWLIMVDELQADMSIEARPFPGFHNQNGRCVPDINRGKQPSSLGKELPEELRTEAQVEFS